MNLIGRKISLIKRGFRFKKLVLVKTRNEAVALMRINIKTILILRGSFRQSKSFVQESIRSKCHLKFLIKGKCAHYFSKTM